MNQPTEQSGFAALILVVMVSSLLLAVLTASAGTAIVHRLAVAATEERVQNSYTAESCAHLALVQVAYDKRYAGGETLSSGPFSCSIEPIPPPVNGRVEIKARAVLNHKVNSAEAVIDESTLSIISWHIN